ESVHFDRSDLIHLLDSVDNLMFVGENVNDENEGVVIFDPLHGALGGEGELQDAVLIEPSAPWGGAARIFWLPRKAECLWSPEVDCFCCRCSFVFCFFFVCSFVHSLFCFVQFEKMKDER